MNMIAIQSDWEHVSQYLGVITKETDYQDHLELLSQLMDEVGDNLDHPLSGFLDLLSIRIEEYEQKIFPIQDATPIEVLKLLMEQRGMNQKDLANKGFDNQGNISKILNGKREMNLKHIKVVCEVFGVNADLFF